MSRVHFIAPWYEYYPILCDSLRLQTFQDWSLDLIHDGPQNVVRQGEWRNDERITIRETDHRFNDWGHSLRDDALRRVGLMASKPEFIVCTNADNYYVPVFLQMMLDGIAGHAAAYCDCVHSHCTWRVLGAELKLGFIDCGSVMARTNLAISPGWQSRAIDSDWTWIDSMLKQNSDWVHVVRPIFIHN